MTTNNPFSRLPDDWFEGRTNFKKLTEQAVDQDRWDLDDLARMINKIPPFNKARNDLKDFTPTGRPALNDVFWELLKAEPTVVPEGEVRPDHLINRVVAEEMLGLDELEKLRHYSVGDDVQSALSASILAETVKTIFDRLKTETEQQQEFMQSLMQLAKAAGVLDDAEHDLDEMMARLTGEDQNEDGDEDGDDAGAGDGDEDGAAGDDGAPGDGGEGDEEGDSDGNGQPGGSGGKPKQGQAQGGSPSPNPGDPGFELNDAAKEQLEQLSKAVREAQEAFDEAKGEAEAKGDELEKSLDHQTPMIAALLKDSLNTAAQEARDEQQNAHTWGLDPGELVRMDPKERMELAKRLNSDRFKRIADLFGPMRNMQLSEMQRKTTNSREEIFDVETGNDLSHLLPSELLNLDDELTELDFLRRYTERGLMQYALQGTERLARGGIIFCEDGSGSMSGERELWAKAVMLCLLHLARQQGRTMHVIHFGGPGKIKHMPFVQPEDFSLDRILDAAELFFNGGTDFVTPMKHAQGILQAEYAATGGVKADVVFVTDDECWVDEAYMREYLDEMHRMDATTWGISVTGRQPSSEGALSQMCEGKTCTVKDFASGGDVREVFRMTG